MRKFLRSEEGGALAEYVVLLALVALASVVAVTYFGKRVSEKYSALADAYTTGVVPAAPPGTPGPPPGTPGPPPGTPPVTPGPPPGTPGPPPGTPPTSPPGRH